jgi:hypothetical protein
LVDTTRRSRTYMMPNMTLSSTAPCSASNASMRISLYLRSLMSEMIPSIQNTALPSNPTGWPLSSTQRSMPAASMMRYSIS